MPLKRGSEATLDRADVRDRDACLAVVIQPTSDASEPLEFGMTQGIEEEEIIVGRILRRRLHRTSALFVVGLPWDVSDRVLHAVMDTSAHDEKVIQICWELTDGDGSTGHAKLMGVGCIVTISGRLGASLKGEACIFTMIPPRLERAPGRDPFFLNRVLCAMVAGDIPRLQAERAMGCRDGLDDFQSLCDLCVGESNWNYVSKELKSRLVRLSRLLANLPCVKRKSWCKRHKLSALDHTCIQAHAEARTRAPIIDSSARCEGVNLNLDSASDARIDFMNAKKGPQIGFLLHIMSRYLELSDGKVADVVDVVDVGGGRGDLALNIAMKFGNSVQVTVVEPNECASQAGRKLCVKYSLSNISFKACGIEDFDWDSLSHSKKLVCSLHACGGLSDYVTNAALLREIPFLVVTCCFRSNNYLRQLNPIDKTVGADFERLCKLSESPEEAVSQAAMHSVNSLRIAALDAHSKMGIVRFPIKWSPRNQILCSRHFLQIFGPADAED